MINATSPAAKNSFVKTDAISARDTRRSALMSCSNITPLNAPIRIGIPHKTIAIQAISNGKVLSNTFEMLNKSEITDTTVHIQVSFGSFSNQFLVNF